MTDFQRAWAVLGLSPTNTCKDVDHKYRKAALKHHPDRPGGNTERFKELQRLYEAARAVCVQQAAAAAAPPRPPSPSPPPPFFRRSKVPPMRPAAHAAPACPPGARCTSSPYFPTPTPATYYVPLNPMARGARATPRPQSPYVPRSRRLFRTNSFEQPRRAGLRPRAG